jgi:hypothetical protein
MNDSSKGKSAGPTRDDRRAKALRENLKRRKAQARGRARTEPVEKPAPGRDSVSDSSEPGPRNSVRNKE